MSTEFKEVFAISEAAKEDDSARWTRIGICFTNKDGSFNVILDAIPVNGRLHIRDRKTKEQKK